MPSTGCRALPRARYRCRTPARSARRRPARPARRDSACSTPARRPAARAAHILETADVALTALDADAARCADASTRNLARLGLAAPRCALRIARAPEAWWDGAPFDRILADVPCSASGRRAPPSRHQVAAPRDRHRRRSRRGRRAFSTRFGGRSPRVVNCCMSPVRCFPEENGAVVDAFAARTRGRAPRAASPDGAPAQLLPGRRARRILLRAAREAGLNGRPRRPPCAASLT